MIPLSEAQEFVLNACPVLEPISVRLEAALDHVSAEDITAIAPVPPFDNTAMDGFAVRAADTLGAPVTLEVIGDLAAGSAPQSEVGPGQAIRIMTGAPMPGGADAIVMVELTNSATQGEVEVRAVARPGDHVRQAGSDLAPDDTVVTKGTVLSPAHIGLLASVGRSEVSVIRQPIVGVLSTGDELIDGDGPLRPAKIYDSNRLSLLSALRSSGFKTVDLGLASDDEASIESAMAAGVEACDAIITSGGVSVGDFDYTKIVLDKLSEGTMKWMQIAIKPAKPFAFGLIKGVPLFGLPGNPVSSMVSFECLARPALRNMAGFAKLGRERILAIADEPFPRRADDKLHLMRAVASIGEDGRLHVRSAGGQGSHQLAAMANANCLALVPNGSGLGIGDQAEVMLLRPLEHLGSSV